MRWDSPFVLAAAGTIAIHVILAVVGDAIVVTHPAHVAKPAPHIQLVNIELPPKLAPPPPPVAPPPPPAAAPPVHAAPAPHVHAIRTAPPAPAPTETAPPTPAPSAPSGGAPVVSMPDLAPGATGTVGVAVGPANTGPVGRGGTGGGTGAGIGSGTASAPAPLSVAAIKTRAMPRGDYGYFDASKDYPEEAKQLGIEGEIRVRLVVDAHGRVVGRVLLDHLGHGLDQLALTRAAQIQFDPARDTHDQPVASVVVWTFHMTLPK